MEQDKDLLNKAKIVSENAYAPYSKFKVGAAIEYENGNIYTGCNVENASYGLSICAERNAVSNAVSSGEKSKIKTVAIYSPNQKKCMPCGACRQWIAEFSSDNTRIILEDDDNKIISMTLEEIFPNAFSIEG